VREGAKAGEHGTVNTHAKTGCVVGTNGYMPPEYKEHGHVSDRLDSYAFSIVLLELLTGKVRNTPSSLFSRSCAMPRITRTSNCGPLGSVVNSQLCKTGITAAALHHEEPDLFEEMMHFVDPRAGQWPPPVVEGLAAVAELCIQFHARKRASVRDVVPQLDALV
jgi:serine/threonine protein kinase